MSDLTPPPIAAKPTVDDLLAAIGPAASDGWTWTILPDDIPATYREVPPHPLPLMRHRIRR